jgi:hypothetical protein
MVCLRLGANGDPNVPGLGFRYDTDERWSLPNPTGLQGIFEGYCPPHHKNMRDATEALAKRKFGEGGVYNPNTPGAWSDSPKVRGSAVPILKNSKNVWLYRPNTSMIHMASFQALFKVFFVLCMYRLSI